MAQAPTRRGLLLAAAATLAGCGFELRRAPELPFRRIQLTGFKPHSAIAAELRTALQESANTQVVGTLSQAQVVLESLADALERGVVASSSAGQVTELQIRARFKFVLRSATGKELIEPTELFLKRDMSYTENAALGKEQEEALLARTMQSDIVAQVLRRLASVRSL